MLIVDNLIALRIMYLLVKPFKSWPACKQGIIDEGGNLLIPKKSSSDWTMLHKMVAKLKRFIQLAPGGKSVIASLIGAYMLVKESALDVEEFWPRTDEELYEDFINKVNNLTEEDINQYIPLLEEIGSGVAIAAGTAPDEQGNVEPIVNSVKNKYTKRNQKNNNLIRRNNLPSFKAYINGE